MSEAATLGTSVRYFWLRPSMKVFCAHLPGLIKSGAVRPVPRFPVYGSLPTTSRSLELFVTPTCQQLPERQARRQPW